MSKKNHIQLTRYYHYAATLPFCMAILLGIFLSAVHEQDPKYASEYFVDDGFRETLLLYIAFSLMISFLSFTIFFNSYKRCSDHILYSWAAWMLLPFAFLLVAFYRFMASTDTFSYGKEANQTLDYFFVFIIFSHVIALLVSFFRFRITLSRAAELNT